MPESTVPLTCSKLNPAKLNPENDQIDVPIACGSVRVYSIDVPVARARNTLC